MTQDRSTNDHQTWQDALDPRLTGRLMRPLVKPGIVGNEVAGQVLSRTQRMISRLPLLAELAQRYSSAENPPAGQPPIVYAQRWLSDDAEDSRVQESPAAERPVVPAISIHPVAPVAQRPDSPSDPQTIAGRYEPQRVERTIVRAILADHAVPSVELPIMRAMSNSELPSQESQIGLSIAHSLQWEARPAPAQAREVLRRVIDPASLVLPDPPAGASEPRVPAVPGTTFINRVAEATGPAPSAPPIAQPPAATQTEPVASGGGGKTDVDELVDKALRKLIRQLDVEGERRGWKRWP